MKTKRILFIILALFVATALFFAISMLSDKSGKKNGEAVTVMVESGESLSAVTKRMQDAGIIKYEYLFKRYAIGKGADVNLKTGEHIMYKNMGYEKAVEELLSDGAGNTLTFTFPEGFEVKRIAESLEGAFTFTAEDFIKAAKKDYGFSFIEKNGEREILTEGYLFPDTYEFYKWATAEDVAEKLLSGFNNVWTKEYDERCTEIGMTRDEVITLASIIEREAGSEEEMPRVSSVFHNRLEIGMALQSCATVQYILDERKDVLSLSDTKIDSPYNTYLYNGLPAGPIANPGRAAIKAALYPEETDYYYFKLNSDGVTVFSKTLSEHNGK